MRANQTANIGIAVMLLGFILIGSGYFIGLSGVNPCTGQVQATFYVFDGNTRAPISGAQISDPAGTIYTNSAGQATQLIDGTQAGWQIQISAPNYLSMTYTDNFCVGTVDVPSGVESVTLSFGLNPTSILNVPTTANQQTLTITQYINSTFYSTTTYTTLGNAVTSTVTSVSKETNTLTIPPLVISTTITQRTTLTVNGTVTVATAGQTVTKIDYVCDSGCTKQSANHVGDYVALSGLAFLGFGAFITFSKKR